MLKLTLKLKHRHSLLQVIGMALAMILSTLSQSESGQVNLVSFYPGPEGVYDRLMFIPPSSSQSNPCEIGSISTDPVTGKVVYCSDDGTGSGKWGTFSSLWTQVGNFVYPESTISNKSTFVGIGTSTPLSRLTLDNDGGILATGTFGTGQNISNFNYRTDTSSQKISRLIWYPKRAIFRAVTLSVLGWPSTETFATDDSYMGDYSMSFGYNSNANHIATFVGGGNSNIANGDHSAVIGGQTNTASGSYSLVTGGANNSAIGNYSSVTGYVVAAYDDYSTASGYWVNSKGINATVLGCFGASFGSPAVSAPYSTIIGGSNQNAKAPYSVIAGGLSAGTGDGTLGGAAYSTIAGSNTSFVYADHATIGGGDPVGISASTASYATIAGGGNSISTSVVGPWASVTGGYSPSITNVAMATAIGGYQNTIQSTCSTATGYANTIGASGSNSVVSGANNNTNATYSWAGGRFMTLSNAANRSFVWGYSGVALSTTQANSFIIANQKVGIGVTNPTAVLSINGNGTDHYLAITSTNAAMAGNILMVKNNGYLGIGKSDPQYPLDFGNGAFLTTVGVFTNASSRALKENIHPVDTQKAIDAALKLDPVIYNYKVAKDEHHVGFIAEDVPDFVASKGRKSVNPMNVTAVLTAVVKEQKSELAEQDKIISDLKAKVDALKTRAQW